MASKQSDKKLRLDKWLWAARFFKTRNLAKFAIQGGKVKVSGRRVKASYELKVGDFLKIPQGWEDIEVVVLVLVTQRTNASDAKLLYQETDKSVSLRTSRNTMRKLAGTITSRTKDRPDRRARKKIRQLKTVSETYKL